MKKYYWCANRLSLGYCAHSNMVKVSDRVKVWAVKIGKYLFICYIFNFFGLSSF